MAKEMKDLQALIQQRAERKLDDDLKNLREMVEKHPLLANSWNDGTPLLAYDKNYEPADVNRNREQKWERLPTSHLLACYTEQLKAFWLPRYIAKESELFLKKVDEMQENIDYLLNNQPYQQ